MTSEELKQFKASLSITAVAQALGVEVVRGRCRCFYPQRHVHGDRTPSVSISEERGSFRCWVCDDVRGDVISLVQIVKNCSFTEALDWLVETYPFLLPGGREAALRVFDLELTPKEICATSAEIEDYLRASGVEGRRSSKAALLVEEALMVVRDRNAGRRIRAEATVDLNEGLVLVLRDDGVIFDITDVDARISSLRSYLVSNLMTAIPNRRNLTTTGFNRNVFRL